ncbi:hypothetical protein HN747_02170 [archaeon]|jgi:hypothetical protein|nr:hypothetical protein [archaeon]
MSMFSKKKSGVPELPRAPTLPKITEPVNTSHMLPSMSSKTDVKLGNDMVKSAVTDETTPIQTSPMTYLPPASSVQSSHAMEPEENHEKQVFVKLDKFTQAQKTFSEMKEKLTQIEILVGKAAEVNDKEKTEITSWNQALGDIRSKVHELDSEIFNQI